MRNLPSRSVSATQVGLFAILMAFLYYILSPPSSSPSIKAPKYTVPPALSVPGPCSHPFSWEEGNCMVKLGDLNFELQVRGRIPSELDGNVPIIFPSPGWGLACEHKFAGLQPLFENYTFLCMVTRGTYPSDPPANDSDMSSTDMAHDLELLRKWLGLEQLRLYGHSIGGTIILGYAEFYPECVSSLVLVDSKMLDYDDTLTLMEFVTNRYTDPRYTNSIAALMISANFSNPAYPENDSAYRELLLQLLPWYFSNPELYEPSFASLVRSVPPPQNWATVVHDKCNIRNPTPNKALLGEVKAPTLIIVGEDDAFCTKVVAEIMHAGIKGSELVVYEDCGHLPWIERKEDFVEKMKDWWVKH